MLDTDIRNQIPTMAGVFVLILLIFFACGIYLFVFNKSMASHRKETLLLFTLYVIELIALSLLGGFEYYVLPLLVFPMLVSILINVQASVVLTMGLTAVGFFIVEGSIDYLLFYFVAGIIIAILSRYTTERNKIFLVGFLIALLNFILSCAVAFIVEKAQALQMLNTILVNAAFNSLNGILTVIICIGTLPFWETFFGVVTPVKLLDLTNPTNPLLRRLTIEAPGTYHHALIVANLAETAAYDIGANPHTARAGGYYHDIGKLKYPQYFAENLAGENPHDHMDPWNSVQLIVSHVAYGLTLAAEYRLPQFIRDIIDEHHGTSLIQFFFVKAKEENPNVNEADFRYPYTIPQTRESACVMLADTVEAAVRAMIPHVKSVDEVEGKINSLIRHKLNDGQLADSQLSIKDVAVIEASFFRVLKGMYHERIPYPKIAEGEK
jgi:putative nucleotidyltransferase with HDIG domain